MHCVYAMQLRTPDNEHRAPTPQKKIERSKPSRALGPKKTQRPLELLCRVRVHCAEADADAGAGDDDDADDASSTGLTRYLADHSSYCRIPVS